MNVLLGWAALKADWQNRPKLSSFFAEMPFIDPLPVVPAAEYIEFSAACFLQSICGVGQGCVLKATC